MAAWKILMILGVSFLGGIFVGAFFVEGRYWEILGVLVFGFFIKKLDESLVEVLVVIFLGLLLGFFRFVSSFEDLDFEEGFVELEGCIVEEVDVRRDKTKYVLAIEGLGKVLVNGPRYPVFEFGDCLRVRGILEEPGQIEDFAYDKYLARYDIYALIFRAGVEKISDAESGGGLLRFKFFFEERLGRVFGEPHASFMGGLLLGSRKGIPDELMEDFNITGLTHIIAISGYNITLLIVIVGGFFGFLGRKGKVIAAIVFIVIFVILVGASAAVVRAAVMGVIGLLALWYGRQYRVELALLMAAFVMNLWNPKILVYDVGFQLSFLATAGLIYVVPKIERYFLFLPQFLAIRESVLMTLAAQILALPVIILSFGRLSLISPLANLFVLPLLPLAMCFGFFAVFFSLFGFFGYLILELAIFFVRVFAKVPHASVDWGAFPWWIVPLYYFFIFRRLF